jgi:basic membrane lipoprotein Med (substrate-binding protein (PBP1-ABC) superfamily)
MIDLFAWVGAVAALAAYFLLASGRVGMRVFNWSEFLAAFPLGFSAVAHRAYPALVVTVSYGAVGLYGIARDLAASEDLRDGGVR